MTQAVFFSVHLFSFPSPLDFNFSLRSDQYNNSHAGALQTERKFSPWVWNNPYRNLSDMRTLKMNLRSGHHHGPLLFPWYHTLLVTSMCLHSDYGSSPMARFNTRRTCASADSCSSFPNGTTGPRLATAPFPLVRPCPLRRGWVFGLPLPPSATT